MNDRLGTTMELIAFGVHSGHLRCGHDITHIPFQSMLARHPGPASDISLLSGAVADEKRENAVV
jgi:hypothetical protein